MHVLFVCFRLNAVQCRALTCLQNILLVSDVDCLGGASLQSIAQHLSQLVFAKMGKMFSKGGLLTPCKLTDIRQPCTLCCFNAILLVSLSLQHFKVSILNVGRLLTKQFILIRCVYPNCILSK